LLGAHAVSGFGDSFKTGGRVVKNVTGYDLCKLLAGSWGTLAVMTEVTLKVMPKPESERTLMLAGLDDVTANRAMTAALGSPYDVSGAAHLPGSVFGTATGALARGSQGDVIYDWGGGLIWAALPPKVDAHAALLRQRAEAAGGHAALLRAPAEVRHKVDVFHPQAPGIAALSERVRNSFDPKIILNRGRMVRAKAT
jgi:FAD/FMN-containing dehydrogenase